MSYIDPILTTIKSCGKIILNADRAHLTVDEKEGKANFVTTYDKKIESILKKDLLSILPDAKFIGEESEQDEFSDKGRFFIVDPIDGTTNFIKDYKQSVISVALIEDGEAVFGAVYNPYLDELFTAEAGKGAFCNDKPIHVSDEPLENGIVLVGTALYYRELAEKTFAMALDYFNRSCDIRRSGSAALDLCSVAAGRAELFFELGLCPWDYAAGALIVKEAGGVVTTVEGSPFSYDRRYSIKATNGRCS